MRKSKKSPTQILTTGSSTCWAGFDCGYPIPAATAKTWWADSPFWWLGYYLGGCCCLTGPKGWTSPNEGQAISYSTLSQQGWGLRGIYVGTQAYACNSCAAPSTEPGITDAEDAATQAAKAGFPIAATIYFDVEQAKGVSTLPTAYLDYIVAWIHEIADNTNYTPGLYGGGCYLEQIFKANSSAAVPFWLAGYESCDCTVQPDLCPSSYDGGCPGTLPSNWIEAWQYCIACDNSYGELTIRYGNDLDCAISTGSGGESPGY